MNEELRKALWDVNLTRAAELLAAGADINEYTEHGESLLDDVTGFIYDAADRHAVVSFMLEHGADPRLLTADGSGPLFAAVIAQDTPVLRLLLDHGADPNLEHDLSESLYDYAEFDYRFETYDINNLPEQPTDADKASEDAWLQFLDRIAIKYGKRRPDYLILLRERGALTGAEQKLHAGNAARVPFINQCLELLLFDFDFQYASVHHSAREVCGQRGIALREINVNDDQELATQYDVRHIPQCILLRGGRIIGATRTIIHSSTTFAVWLDSTLAAESQSH